MQNNKKQNNHRLLLRGLVFLLILLIVVCGIQRYFGLDSKISYEHERGYLKEEDNSLDAVYIGGSDVHAFWQPCFGWIEKGIAVWNYSTDSLPMAGVKYMLIEARKTQENAFFIISLSTFKKESTACITADIHWAVDYMPVSLNKVRLINRLTNAAGITGLEKLEYYFPIIRFHSRWDSLGKWAFGAIDADYKASMDTDSFRSSVMDLTESISQTDTRAPLPEDVNGVVTELLDYCDAEQLQILFVKPPQANSEEELQRMNTLEDIVTERGYPCLDLMEHMDDVGVLPQTDFYNEAHTNVHGSLKFSRVLADYLVEHYGFSDKRGLDNWKSWDEASIAYMNSMRSVTLPFERSDSLRDYTLSVPVPEEAETDNSTVTLAWTSSDGAEGYEIYRLCPGEDNSWQRIAELGSSESSWIDTGLKADSVYSYTVVPFRMLSGERAYGNFDVTGVTAKTGGRS